MLRTIIDIFSLGVSSAASVMLIGKTVRNPYRLTDLRIKTAITTGYPEAIEKTKFQQWLSKSSNQKFLNDYCDSLRINGGNSGHYAYNQQLKTNIITSIGLPIVITTTAPFGIILVGYSYVQSWGHFVGSIGGAYTPSFMGLYGGIAVSSAVTIAYVCLLSYNVYCSVGNCKYYLHPKTNTEILEKLKPYYIKDLVSNNSKC